MIIKENIIILIYDIILIFICLIFNFNKIIINTNKSNSIFILKHFLIFIKFKIKKKIIIKWVIYINIKNKKQVFN